MTRVFMILAVVVLCASVLQGTETIDISFNPSDPTPGVGEWYNAYDGSVCIIVWIEDSTGNLVKTLDVEAGVRWHSCYNWVNKAGFNLDEVSGATYALSGVQPTITLTNLDLSDVPDGTYNIKMEATDKDGPSASEINVGTFSFTKDGTAATQSGLSSGGFTNVTLDYKGRTGTNLPPAVFAGPDIFPQLTNGAATLAGVVTDPDTAIGSVTIGWSVVSVPVGGATVTFTDSTSPTTTATFSVDGTYELQLSADDSTTAVTDNIFVYVNGAVIDAQEDTQITNASGQLNNTGNNDIRLRVWKLSGGTSHAFVKFDLSSIPGDITEGTLFIPPNDFGNNSSEANENVTRTISTISDDSLWDASTLTWNIYTGTAGLDGTILTTFTTDNVNFGWVPIDVTSFLQGEQDTQNRASFRIWYDIGGTDLRSFRLCSTNTQTPSRLLVTYNENPSAAASASGSWYDFTLDASSSTDDGAITYEYDFDYDGVTFTVDYGSTANNSQAHTYAAAGSYTVAVRVTDERGVTDIATDTVTAVDPSAAGSIEFQSASFSVSEGLANGDIVIIRTGGGAAGASVELTAAAVNATAGTDYTITTPQTITFAALETSKTVTVTILGDTDDEPNETIDLSIASPGGGASLGTQATATFTILDDDAKKSDSGGGCAQGTSETSIHLILFLGIAMMSMVLFRKSKEIC